eukprot:gnl/TRDRNA2_/TRDRNA2_168016_c0_seq4.p1 gnl/TRDRNA2_/TRDRNA2_168016_c0~~gnl/TRDRNA2_/TRDRNA2_168016_c0_seq4.p1  ORF type:complete len:513 (-),score=62.25 gnl/TRDRNA2_/TRDRNA2_168016_c0_seq4:41-1579(-)
MLRHSHRVIPILALVLAAYGASAGFLHDDKAECSTDAANDDLVLSKLQRRSVIGHQRTNQHIRPSQVASEDNAECSTDTANDDLVLLQLQRRSMIGQQSANQHIRPSQVASLAPQDRAENKTELLASPAFNRTDRSDPNPLIAENGQEADGRSNATDVHKATPGLSVLLTTWRPYALWLLLLAVSAVLLCRFAMLYFQEGSDMCLLADASVIESRNDADASTTEGACPDVQHEHVIGRGQPAMLSPFFLFLCVELLEGLNCASFGPTSLRLSIQLGTGTTYTASMMSCFKNGNLVGTLALRWLIRSEGDLVADSRRWLRTCSCSAVFCMLLCSLASLYFHANIESFVASADVENLLLIFLALRFLSGMAGAVVFIITPTFPLFTVPSSRALVFSCLTAANIIGIGLGPLLSAMSIATIGRLATPVACLAAVQACTLAMLLLKLPSMDRAHILEAAPSDKGTETSSSEQRFKASLWQPRNAFVVFCIVFGLMRASAVSRVNKASALMIERGFF